MTHVDCRGLDTSSQSAEEVAAYDAGLELFLNYENSAGAAMKAVLTEHPENILATLLRGYMMMMIESSAVHGKVAQTAAGVLASAHANGRERDHAHALAAWASGDVFGAGLQWERILAAHPHDLLALKMHHYTTFWTGRANVLLHVVDGVVDAWDTGDIGYDHMLGMRSFALNETGHYEAAEQVAREAVAMNAEDLWSIHAVAHALEMQGALAAGDEFFDVDPERWATKNLFVGHIWWHAALFPWNAGDYDRVLQIYDERLRPASTDFFLDIQNLSSLLTRLELCGVDVGGRWDELGDHAVARIEDHVLAFTDVHCALTLERTARSDDLDMYRAALAWHLDEMPADHDRSGSEAALAVTDALIHAVRGDLTQATSELAAARTNLTPVGGSHAQRDVFDLLLADYAERSGDLDFARHVVRARRHRWPNSIPTQQRWDRLSASA